MRNIKTICQQLCLWSLVVLTGCGPMYKTSYSFIPPTSMEGRMCTMQCNQTKNMCEQMQQMRNETCRSRARDEARWRYEDYVRERRDRNLPVEKSMRDFESSYGAFSCADQGNCENDFRTCFTTCGGQVLAHEQCVAFCDKR